MVWEAQNLQQGKKEEWVKEQKKAIETALWTVDIVESIWSLCPEMESIFRQFNRKIYRPFQWAM